MFICILGDADSLTELAKIYGDKPAILISGAPVAPVSPAGVLRVDPAAQTATGDLLCTQTIHFAKSQL